jgi:N-methylhydantoinase A/oxoprolinase/acetone carboxylase beta subunit
VLRITTKATTKVATKVEGAARIGIDTGGTFTDFVCLEGGKLRIHKRRSTPDDPSRSILEGIAQLSGKQPPSEVVQGSTVATNAVLERKGARVALVVTAGFEDVLAIGRQTRPELYNLFVPPRRPLVDPGLVFGVTERIDVSGVPLVRLDETALAQLAQNLLANQVDIVAVCFLHSYAYPAHEHGAAQLLRRAGLRVCSSNEILPEYREFERWSTTVVNAYIAPLMDQYLGRLEQRLAGSRLRIMQSNGGSISAAAARTQPVRTVLSGPAAGLVGAHAVAREAGFNRIISFDMGGTSTDVSLVDGDLSTTTDTVIGDFPVRLPILDIHTVGAGGGSVATLDAGGALRVGPQSAGAVPGPACYGTGDQFTVTDANLLLGRLEPEYFLGGRMPLDKERAQSIAASLAGRLKLSIPKLAEGVVRVANANMERAIRVVSVQRGYDPREFTLVAFGGAGGMHACALADQLEIGTVLVPRYAGVLSALGMLQADVTKDYSVSVLKRGTALSASELRRRFVPLVAEAQRALRLEGFSPGRQVIARLLDVRYAGQSYEIEVPFSPEYSREFHRRHDRLYGYSDPLRPTEVVNLRVTASGITDKPRLPRSSSQPNRPQPTSTRLVWFGGRRAWTSFFRWPTLPPGAHASGPAIVTGDEATVVVLPGFRFSVDAFGNLIIRRTTR